MDVSLTDAFDLPDWLGTEPVRWRAETGLDESPLVRGTIGAAGGRSQPLDVLAVDAAYPSPVCPERERTAAHQAWQFGEVALLSVDGRAAAAVPGSEIDLETLCEALRRFAKSVGAASGNYTVAITL
jgi:hypothetical protein